MVQFQKNVPVWKKAYRLGLKVYETTSYFPKNEAEELVIDLRNTSVDITAHLEIGFTEHLLEEYIRCFKHSFIASLNLRRDIHESHSLGYIGDKIFRDMEGEINQILELLSRQITHLDYLNSSLDANRAYCYTYLHW